MSEPATGVTSRWSCAATSSDPSPASKVSVCASPLDLLRPKSAGVVSEVSPEALRERSENERLARPGIGTTTGARDETSAATAPVPSVSSSTSPLSPNGPSDPTTSSARKSSTSTRSTFGH